MLTDDEQQRVNQALRLGLQRDQAAYVAGVTQRRLGELLQAAERGDETARAILDAWDRSEAACTAALMNDLRTAGASGAHGGWRASAFLLERRFPESWRKPTAPDEATMPVAAFVAFVQAAAEIINELAPDLEARTAARSKLASAVEKAQGGRAA